MRFFLAPVAWIYAAIIIIRNKAFDWGLLKRARVGVPVISVGNLTMGGTGKTPMVEYIVGYCLSKGKKAAVVSRGYKRKSEGVLVVSDGQNTLVDAVDGGDEPVQIAKKFPAAIVVVGEKRIDAARRAIDLFGANVIVLDDGFQHRYLVRDLDILMLDARKDVFRIPMIPSGARREPLTSIERAHVIAFSRADATPSSKNWTGKIEEKHRMPKVWFRYKLESVHRVGASDRFSPRDLKGTKFFLFSGIGDHKGFVDQMTHEGIDVVGDAGFPDHHSYSGMDRQELAHLALRSGANAFLTTEKDAVRLLGDIPLLEEFVRDYPLFHAGIAVDILSGKAKFDATIDVCLGRTVA